MSDLLTARPTSPSPDLRMLVVLDVDGVLNTFVPGELAADRELRHGYWVTPEGRDPIHIQTNAEIIAALDEQLRRPGVQLGWLTTWAGDLEALITEAFRGRLAGGYVIAGRPEGTYVPEDWKHRALLEHLDEIGKPAYIWADDDAVALSLMTQPEYAAATNDRLLIDATPTTGITVDEVQQIADFITEHLPN
jgi:hypothetical protein